MRIQDHEVFIQSFCETTFGDEKKWKLAVGTTLMGAMSGQHTELDIWLEGDVT
tara:strand:- start:19924 stop:20082 length:159 start_codon:yes stop_codon:yes gene_type:complete